MAITITLYKYGGNRKKVQKNLGEGTSIVGTITFRDTAELHSPYFTVGANLSADYNYCSISGVDETTRYYFCTVSNIRTGLSGVDCTIDVLKTYNVLDVPVVPARSSSRYNSYLIDGRYPIETTIQHYNVPFEGGAILDYNNLTLVAGIVGSGGTPTDL